MIRVNLIGAWAEKNLGPVYAGPDKSLHGQKLAQFHLAFTRDRRNWTNFERPSVQVWDLKKAGQLFDRHGSIFVRTRVNARTVHLFAQIARLWPGFKCRDWSKLCTDPCKHHRNRICTDPCKQAVQEQNSFVQKLVRTRVNGALVWQFFILLFDPITLPSRVILLAKPRMQNGDLLKQNIILFRWTYSETKRKWWNLHYTCFQCYVLVHRRHLRSSFIFRHAI